MGVVDGAAASSIVFTKGGNVWRSSPDGRHQSKLTRGGGYSSPSQDDRGRVYAIQRGRFVRLSPKGRRIDAPFNAAVGRSGNVTAYGPWEAQVSPDGSRIAYWRGIQRLDAPLGGMTPYELEDQVVVSRRYRLSANTPPEARSASAHTTRRTARPSTPTQPSRRAATRSRSRRTRRASAPTASTCGRRQLLGQREADRPRAVDPDWGPR